MSQIKFYMLDFIGELIDQVTLAESSGKGAHTIARASFYSGRAEAFRQAVETFDCWQRCVKSGEAQEMRSYEVIAEEHKND